MHRASLTLLAACSFRPFAASPDAATIGDDDAPVLRDAPADASLDAPADVAIDAFVAPFCDPSDPALVACYEFDNGTTDSSSHGHDANVHTNVTFITGEVGQAADIGATTEIDVPDSSAFDVSTFTVEAWISPDQLPAAGARAGILDCDGQFGFFLRPNGDVSCSASANLQVAAGVTVGQWTHVACTYDGATIRIYTNGSLVGSTASGPPPTGGTTGITLGGNNPPGGGDPLHGGLDQLRLFSTPRAPADICADAGKSTCP